MPCDDFLVEARGQFLIELGVAENVARLQKRGADGHVRLGLADALVDRAGGVADLEPHVPQTIEQRLGDGFTPGRLLVREQKQQIDVGAGRQQAAAVAAGRDHRHVLGLGRHLRRVELADDGFEQQADDLVLHPAQPLGAAPAVTVLEQQLFGLGPPLRQRRLEPQSERNAQFALAPGMACGGGLEVGGDRRRIDQGDGVRRGALGVQHGNVS